MHAAARAVPACACMHANFPFMFWQNFCTPVSRAVECATRCGADGTNKAIDASRRQREYAFEYTARHATK